MHISHETIYRILYVQARGALNRSCWRICVGAIRCGAVGATRLPDNRRGQIVDAVSISERPASVEGRAVPGHWKGDLLAGAKNTHIATLVERQSCFVQLLKMPNGLRDVS